SDGGRAMREVLERQANARPSGARGPKNQTLQHWHTPKAEKDKGEKKWVFQYRNLSGLPRRVRHVARTADMDDYAKETKRARLGNLSMHMKEKHEEKVKEMAEEKANKEGETADDDDNTEKEMARQCALIRKFVEQGILNPAREPSQAGFNRVFAAWLLDNSHMFTSGEVPSLQYLFKYIRCELSLPSDKTSVALTPLIGHFIAMTMDNVSSNDVLAHVLGRLLMKCYKIPFHPENGQIHCLTHVINLVVQKILSTLKEVDDPDIQDYYETLNKNLPLDFVLEDEDEDNAAMEADNYDDVYDTNDCECDEEEKITFNSMSALEKVCNTTASYSNYI
ncbi:hypothetical protein OF83DRAFT_1070552, partial [Amylostereum chailletii]